MPPRPRNLGGLRTPRPRNGGRWGSTGANGSTGFRVGITSDIAEHYQQMRSAPANIRKNYTQVLGFYQTRLKQQMDVEADNVVYGGWEPSKYERTNRLRNSNKVIRLATRLKGNFQLYAYNTAPYAGFVHEGYFVFNTGVYIPPRPWIRIAMDKIEPDLLADLENAYWSVLSE